MRVEVKRMSEKVGVSTDMVYDNNLQNVKETIAIFVIVHWSVVRIKSGAVSLLHQRKLRAKVYTNSSEFLGSTIVVGLRAWGISELAVGTILIVFTNTFVVDTFPIACLVLAICTSQLEKVHLILNRVTQFTLR